MTLGTPLLLSDKQTTPLSRIPTGDTGAESFLECYLQEIIDQQPNVLPIADFCPRVTGIFSLGREIPVDIGGNRGIIDNLLATDDGHLVIVETKLWRNPQSLREVIGQVLQYGIAVSKLPPIEFEDCLRKASPKSRRLGKGETVAEFVQSQASADSMLGLENDFEEAFDRRRRDGDIVLLIVADCVRSSVERVVDWMNARVGSAPYKLGLVELRLYEVPDVGRIVVPKTLLRIREGSRHVVTVKIENRSEAQVTASVGDSGLGVGERTVAPAPALMTEEVLKAWIRSKNSSEQIQTAERLLELLRSSSLEMKPLPRSIRYGVQVEEDFVPLIYISGTDVYCNLPKRAILALGDDGFVECKRKICSVAEFYRSSEVEDPKALKVCMQRYDALADKLDAFVSVVTEIAGIVRTAMQQNS